MCFCGSEIDFSECCELIIKGQKTAATPENLMRARYSAYATQQSQFIYDTYAKEKRAANPVVEIGAFANSCRFIKLEVLNADASNNTVEFKAYYLYQNTLCILHEISSFVIENDEWKYLDGTLFDNDEVKIGRNDACPCGSNKKYKKCHSI